MLENVDGSHNEKASILLLGTIWYLPCFIFFNFNSAVELLKSTNGV